MKPGSVVFCVDDSNWDEYARKDFSELPISGRLYTVRRVIPNIIDPTGPDGIALAEIFGSWHFFDHFNGKTVFEECHFRKNRFLEIIPLPDIFLSESEVHGITSSLNQ